MKHRLGVSTALACALASVTSASAQEVQKIDIDSQPLSTALVELSRETGIQVSAATEEVEGKNSSSVRGTMTPREALQQLLVGTGLTVRSLGSDGVNVTRDFVSQNEDEFDLGTLVLRGELINREIQRSATSVAVVTGEEIEKRADQDLYDIVERTPGVTATVGEQGFAIRGIDQRATGGLALAVSTQVDGVALPTSESTFFGPYSVWDVDQIEIYRGPQSTQQGRNALAGAIVVRTNDPVHFNEYSLRAEYGSRNFHRLSFVANTPLIEDKLAFRIAGSTQSEDGFVFNPTLGIDYDPQDFDDIRAKILWSPSDEFEAILSFAYTESFGGEDFVSAALFPERINTSNLLSEEGSKHSNLGLRFKYKLKNGFTLENEFNYYVNDYERTEDFDFSPLDLGNLVAGGGSDVIENDLRLRFETQSIEGVVGLFFTQIENDLPASLTADLGFALTGVPNGIPITRNSEFLTEITNYALYGEADISADGILPGLSFTVGARYDVERVEFREAQTVLGLPPIFPPVDADTSGSTTFKAFLPKFGVTYDITQDHSISLTYQRGYRAGSAVLNSGTGALNEVDPEFTDTIEFAYRGSFLDEQLRISANAYYTYWQDQQIFIPGPTFAFNRLDRDLVNAGESEVYGIEFSVEAEATAKLDLFGSIAIAQTNFIDFPSPTLADPTRNFAGNEFPNASGVTAALGASYQFDEYWSAGVDVSFTEGFFFDVDNDPLRRSDDRWLTNVQVNYESEAFSAGFFVRNLFDNDYLITRNLDVVRGGEPRTYGVYVQKDF